ncbi:MAG: hypothetical protein ACYC4K_06140 [Thiobacillus sp.]
MRILVACKRGNISERDKHGHCLCVDCLTYRSNYRKANPRTAYHKGWVAANKEKSDSYQKKWLTANAVKRTEIVKAWRVANPEKVAAISSRARRKWSSNNKAKRLSSVRARQIAKINRTPAWADLSEIAGIYKESARITKETGIPHEVDHIFPLQGDKVSGLHVIGNLQILTRFANRSKGINLCAA